MGINKIVFFVFDPTPRIERRIEAFVDAGFDVRVFGYRFEVQNIIYCNSPKYTFNVIDILPQGVSYTRRLSGLKKIKEIVKQFDSTTLFYFFSLNVAAIAPFLHVKYVFEESDMLFDRFKSKLARVLVIAFNKFVIKKSSITVMTSEGFSDFYFGDKRKDNVEFVPNKVNTKCLELPAIKKSPFDIKHMRFGYAGNIRYMATLNIAILIAKNFPQHEFHFYGNSESLGKEKLADLEATYPNIIVHGLFKNPDDLPSIYASIDFCVCNYDIDGINPRYAEPNKLYEAQFFDTPIIVSPNSFLGKKVRKQQIGFEMDAYDESMIKTKISSITAEQYDLFMHNIRAIPKESLVVDSSPLISRIRSLY